MFKLTQNEYNSLYLNKDLISVNPKINMIDQTINIVASDHAKFKLVSPYYLK